MQTPLYIIDGFCRGQFAVMPRPDGKRNLAEDVDFIRRQGFDTVISFLTDLERKERGLENEESYCKAQGLSYLNFPMINGIAESDTDMVIFVSQLVDLFHSDHKLLFHGDNGTGRSAVVLSLLADRLGICPDKAFEYISDAIGSPVPATSIQKQWVHSMSISDQDMERILPAGQS